MRPAVISALAIGAVAAHYAYGSPAGVNAYLFLGALLLAFGMYTRGMRGHSYWLSLTGLVEAWFVFDYCVYGTALCVLGRSKTPLPATVENHPHRSSAGPGFIAFLGMRWLRQRCGMKFG